ncbi:MAG: hypothetical protein ACXWIU_04345 [Limisphaerales bacterium]
MSTPHQFKGRLVGFVSMAALFVSAALMVSGCGNGSAGAGPAKKADDKAKLSQSSTNEVVIETKAEFDDDVKTTKDPFFPNSKRRFGRVASGKAIAELPKAADLRLRGVIGSPGKYIAMIADKTFAEGDKSQVSVGTNQHLVVQVNKITAKSVTVKVDGEAAPRELLLDAVQEAKK